MGRENDAYQEVLSQVADVVGEMYEKYRRGKGLEEEKDTERQLEILVSKKYISYTYIKDLNEMAEYYERKKMAMYISKLQDYRIRVIVQTEKIPY